MITLPRISIVTPSFNQGKYLEKTILSVLEQGYPNLEYIIIDGGSTDESVEIIRKYEQHLAYWVSEPDRGQSHAINKGFARATGEIFGWLNSDDWYHPGALKAVAEAFVANPEAGAVVGGGDFVDEAGNVIVRTVPDKVTLDTLYSWFDDYFWQPSCFFTRQAWEVVGGLDESLHLSMDYDLWLRIAKKFTFVTTDVVLSGNLKHAAAKTTAQLHESDLATLKLVLKHGGEEAFNQILACYARRLAQFDEGSGQQIAHLNQSVRMLQDEVKQLYEQLAQVAEQLKKTEENLVQMNIEKQQIINSLSWRMTSPLRNVLDKGKSIVTDLKSSSNTPQKFSDSSKNVLFVDYEVPHFDMFAGSRTNFMYLKLLVSMGVNVKLLPADFRKAEPYTSAIEKLGIEVLYGDWYRDNWRDWIVENADQIDFVFFNKPDPTALFIDLIRSVTRAKILYQMHDLHHVRLLRKSEVEHDAAVFAEAERYRQLEDDIFTKADVVLTFSEEEREFIDRNYPGKQAVCVPLYIFESFREQAIDFSKREGIMFVGGYGHAPNADGVIWFVREVLPRIVAANRDIVFYAVGGNPPSELSFLKSRNFRLLGQIGDDELHDMYNKVRMVVIPLRYGAGVKGKTIEAMYEGVPLVSTSIGLEGVPALRQFLNGYDSPEDFASEVVRLYSDQQALFSLSNKEKELVKNNFTLEGAKRVLCEIIH